MNFRKGDKVVYPKHGVSVIEDVCEQSVGGEKKRFYCIRLKTAAKVFVPCDMAAKSGLRPPLKASEARGVLSRLRFNGFKKGAEPPEDWKTRFERNAGRMESGQVEDLLGVLHSLHWVSRRKDLSYREKEMYEESVRLLADELAAAKKPSDPDAMMERIRAAISGAFPKGGGSRA
jgi:CarD family transcriptional regulator